MNNAFSKEILGLTTTHLTEISPDIAIHKDMLTAYQALVKEAKKNNIDLEVASGFRSFERQLLIWNNKVIGIKPIKKISGDIVDIKTLSQSEIMHAILLYSALPGASRHHWGSDIDVFASNLLPTNTQLQLESWEYEKNGYFEKLFNWLMESAHKFDFYFPYDKYRNGVAAEPWHISYEPVASKYQNNLSSEQLAQHLTDINIQGKEVIIEQLPEIFQRYVMNINTYGTSNSINLKSIES